MARSPFIRMARAVLGRPLFWTGAYPVDGLLLDCGPPATRASSCGFVEGRALGRAFVLTHHHEGPRRRSPALRAGAWSARVHASGIPPAPGGLRTGAAARRVVWGGARSRGGGAGERSGHAVAAIPGDPTPGTATTSACSKRAGAGSSPVTSSSWPSACAISDRTRSWVVSSTPWRRWRGCPRATSSAPIAGPCGEGWPPWLARRSISAPCASVCSTSWARACPSPRSPGAR
jgi:hypothetical protein